MDSTDSRSIIATANARIVINGGRRPSRKSVSRQRIDRTTEKDVHVVELFQENDDCFLSFPTYNGLDIHLNTVRRYCSVARGIHEIEDDDGYRVSFNVVQDELFDHFSSSLTTALKRIQREHSRPNSFIFRVEEPEVTQPPRTKPKSASCSSYSATYRPIAERPLPTPPNLETSERKKTNTRAIPPVPPPKPRAKSSDNRPNPQCSDYVNFVCPPPARTLIAMSSSSQGAGSTESIDSGMDSSYFWICSNCNQFNDLSSANDCVHCNQARCSNARIVVIEIEVSSNASVRSDSPNERQKLPSSSASNRPLQSRQVVRRSDVENWQCSFCYDTGIGFNSADNYNCVFCGRMRKDAWQCNGCNSLQQMCVTVCRNCQKWRCKHCTWINGETTRACASCASPKG